MEGLTPEQAAQAAQWGPDFGPPGPVSYIMHIIQTEGERAAISAEQSDQGEAPVAEAPVESQPTSTPTLDTVSESTAMPSSFETSAATSSTSQETFSSAPSSSSDIPSTSQDTSSSDPTPSTSDSLMFTLSPTTSSISTAVSASATDSILYDPIGGSISYDPTTISTSSSAWITSASTSHTSPPTYSPRVTDSSSSDSDMISMSNSRKQAIVGGLAGAIGALILIGILLCFCLRRRHRRKDDEEDEEDGLKKPVKAPMTLATKPSTVRLWSEMALGREPARSTPEISRPRTPSPVDGSLIRVSTEHWSRPFKRKEGMRESLEPAPLRIVNPDGSSRSSTPQEERAGFMRKPRSALAVFLQDGSRSNSRNAVKRGPISYPKPMVGDPIYSSKATVVDRLDTADSAVETQSVGSVPSDTSGPMVTQQPPEDPFLNSQTMLSTMEEVAPPVDTTPPPLSRSYSHFGKNANPFRTQIVPSVALPPRIFSHSNPNMRASNASNMRASNARRSSIGSAYSQKTRRDTAGPMSMQPLDEAKRNTVVPDVIITRSSDQFDLMVSPDQMPPASGILAKAAAHDERVEREKMDRQQREETPEEGSSPNWKLYEGT